MEFRCADEEDGLLRDGRRAMVLVMNAVVTVVWSATGMRSDAGTSARLFGVGYCDGALPSDPTKVDRPLAVGLPKS